MPAKTVAVVSLLVPSFVLGLALTAGVKKRSTKCYGDLRCFPAFISVGRPIGNSPDAPAEINTRSMVYTRQGQVNTSFQLLVANNLASIKNSDFSASNLTKIIVHDFPHTGFEPWMSEKKDEVLKNIDYNVILVDWGNGASSSYEQAAANTRVVGAEIAKLIKTLQVYSYMSRDMTKPTIWHVRPTKTKISLGRRPV